MDVAVLSLSLSPSLSSLECRQSAWGSAMQGQGVARSLARALSLSLSVSRSLSLSLSLSVKLGRVSGGVRRVNRKFMGRITTIQEELPWFRIE